MKKSKKLTAQEHKVCEELVKLINMSTEHFPGQPVKVVDAKACAFFIVGIQPPSVKHSALLSGHVLSPATLDSSEHNQLTLQDLQAYGVTSVLGSFFAEKFEETAPGLLALAEEVQQIHSSSGHA